MSKEVSSRSCLCEYQAIKKVNPVSVTVEPRERSADDPARPHSDDESPGEFPQTLCLSPAQLAAGRQGNIQSPEGYEGKTVISYTSHVTT